MNKLLLPLLATTLLSAPSFADNSGFGVFGAIGQAKHDIEIINDSDTSFAIGGQYRFNSNFAIEVRYDDYGNLTTVSTEENIIGDNKISTDSLSAGVKGAIPLSDQFSIFAKIGFSSWDINTNYSYSSLDSSVSRSGSLSESGTDLYYGFGGEYSINENIVIGLDYTMLTMDIDNDSPDYDIGNFSLSLGYNF